MMRVLITILLFILPGCVCKYSLTLNSLKSTCNFNYGIIISRITVNSFDRKGIPLGFSRDTLIAYNPRCFEITSDEKKVLEKHSNTLDIDTCNFKPSKIIYFHKANINYYWSYRLPYIPGEKHDKIPILFYKEVWYEISNLYADGGSPSHFIYFFIKNNGELIVRQEERH